MKPRGYCSDVKFLTDPQFASRPVSCNQHVLHLPPRCYRPVGGALLAALVICLTPAAAQSQIDIHENAWSLVHDVASGDDANVTDASSLDYNSVDGNFYYGERNSAGDLFRWNPDATTEHMVNRNDYTAGLAIDPLTGDLYAADDFGGVIEKSVFDSNTGDYSTTSIWVSGFGSGDDDTAGIAMVPNDFTGSLNGISPGDALNVDRDNSGNDSMFQWSRSTKENESEIYNDNITTDSWDIAVNSSRVVVSDDQSGADTGGVFEVVNDGSGGLTMNSLVSGFDVRAITFDPLNDDIVFGTFGGELVRLDSAGDASVMISGFQHMSFGGVAFSDDGRRLLVSSHSTNGGNVWEFGRIPEPSSAAVVGLLMLAVGSTRRRRR